MNSIAILEYDFIAKIKTIFLTNDPGSRFFSNEIGITRKRVSTFYNYML